MWSSWQCATPGLRQQAEKDAILFFDSASPPQSNERKPAIETSQNGGRAESYLTQDLVNDLPDNESQGLADEQPAEDIPAKVPERRFQLQDMMKDADPGMLERSVEEGLSLLDDLQRPLEEKIANDEDAEMWIQQIGKSHLSSSKHSRKRFVNRYASASDADSLKENLRKQAVKTKTIIGVVGNTGAGKSSVINAMLDEERLVPTNCMRACTAVVTEISYNRGEKPYHAEIEFIKMADWEKELKVLYADLLDGSGNVARDCTVEDSDAAIAYAKIKAVYPQLTREQIAETSIKDMCQKVSHVLGTVRDISHTDSLLFYKQLQTFVDSKEKSTAKDDFRKREPRSMEFWPLIRVVRLYVKSPALETGAVIVDLPGVHDANAARAAVAEGYLKQCTGLWIVAPITRAVDDKAAKSLLGESFKRQLKMDGGFNAVTFICSKTDDISLEEAQDSLGLQERVGESWAEMERLTKKRRSLEKEIKDMQDTKAACGEIMTDMDDQMEVWEDLKEKLGEGKVVFPPEPSSGESKKRKASTSPKPRSKKQRLDSDDGEYVNDQAETSDESDDGGEDSKEAEEDQQKSQPLTENDINSKLAEFKGNKKSARESKQQIVEKINETRKEVDDAKEEEARINGEVSALCISGRNQYSKGAIQQDFASGIKELDQELAAEEDEENFNPDADLRDYDEVARSLPVFCVSSRGYQKLNGRLRKDPPVPGFVTTAETEIPQLQAHCKKLTEIGRVANCKAFLNKLSQLLNSVFLWSSSDGSDTHLTKEQRDREQKHFNKGLQSLERVSTQRPRSK